MTTKGFQSDAYTGIHPTILQTINDANQELLVDNTYTEKAIDAFKKQFGNEIDVFFVCTGTAANVLCLRALVKPYR